MTAMTSDEPQQQHKGHTNGNESSHYLAWKRPRNCKVFNPGALNDTEDEEQHVPPKKDV
jgi:hypothetical protein